VKPGVKKLEALVQKLETELGESRTMTASLIETQNNIHNRFVYIITLDGVYGVCKNDYFDLT
jgi:hypothetical protein